jgi:ABC-type histidine transport system ATPase subunit
MFDLNGDEFKSQSVAIFNNGVAGKVDNVSIKIEKKKADDADNAPDYRVIFSDAIGSVNLGIYYPSEQSTEQQIKLTVGKTLAIARAVLGDDYVFPNVSTAKEAIDTCMKLVNKEQEDAKVNIFVTYGTQGNPKGYLGVYKNFDFIEKAGTVNSKLRLTKNPAKPQYNDLLERVEPDTAPQEASAPADNGGWL